MRGLCRIILILVFFISLPIKNSWANWVTIDEYGRTLLWNEDHNTYELFFPLGLYASIAPANHNAGLVDDLNIITDSPFNVIMDYAVNASWAEDRIEDIRNYLDAINERGLKIIYSQKDFYPGLRYYPVNGIGPYVGEENLVRGITTEFKDHPAVLAWYIVDELPISYYNQIYRHREIIQEVDGQHPTWIVVMNKSVIPSYTRLSDCIGMDPYPIAYTDIRLAYDWSKYVSEQIKINKILPQFGFFNTNWMVPQAHDINCYYPGNPWSGFRAPTYQEMLNMSFQCLIGGAKGLIFYNFADFKRDSLGFEARWRDMKAVGEIIKSLFPPLLSIGENIHGVTLVNETQIGHNIKYMTKKSGEELYLVTVNLSQNSSYDSIFKLPFKETLIEDIITQRQFRNSTDTLTEHFDPIAVHVYKIKDATPPPTPQVYDEGQFTSKGDQLYASWISEDLESCINEYQYKIAEGSPEGLTFRDWTSTGTNNYATAAGLTLTNGETYYFGVKAKNGVELWSEVGYSDGIKIDITSPTIPIVTDEGRYTTSTTQLMASWSSSDLESSIIEYQYGIGTSPGAINVVGWISAGINTSVTHTGLTLQNGASYYFGVKARNGANLWSDAGYSDGIKVDNTPPATPLITDGGQYTASTAELRASWVSADLESGIGEYQYRITQDSTTGTVIRDWTFVGTASFITVSGLTLQTGKIYYFGVKVQNGAGLWSEIGYSDGIITGQPDLIVTDIKFYKPCTEEEIVPQAGKLVTCKAILKNQGNVPTGIFNVKWFLDNKQVGYGSHEKLLSGEISNGNVRYDWIPKGGTHTLKFVADCDNHIVESNEGNNNFRKTVFINNAPVIKYLRSYANRWIVWWGWVKRIGGILPILTR